MAEGLERLKNLGAQKIYEDTHIPIEHVQAIIHESFDGFSKVQFLGFVSILEREYHEDLSELKAHGLENFAAQKSLSEVESVFIVPKKKKSLASLYILLAVIIFVIFAYFNFSPSEQSSQATLLDDSVIESAQKYSEEFEENETNGTSVLLVESNQTKDEINATEEQNELNTTEEIVETLAPIKETKSAESLEFVSTKKLWLGYINLKTNKHYSKVFTGNFSIDPKEDWLLVFGHGYVDVVLDGEVTKFNSRKKVRLLYKDSQIKSIDLQEFKNLNRGRSW